MFYSVFFEEIFALMAFDISEGSVMKVVSMVFYWNHLLLLSLLWKLFTELTLL